MKKIEYLNGILDGTFIILCFVSLKIPAVIYVNLGIACFATLVNVIAAKPECIRKCRLLKKIK